jgi:hypothetical protein
VTNRNFVLLFAISAGLLAHVSINAAGEQPNAPATRPDLNGIWVSDAMSFINPQRGPDGSVLCIVGCRPPAAANAASAADGAAATPAPAAPRARPKPPRPNYKPEFQAKVADLDKRQVETDPALRCRNPGLPRIGPPSAIVQQDHQVVFLYEDLNGSFFRMIPTDGRSHRKNAEESYLGDSIGRYEGDTLVVEAVNFVEDTWLVDDGSFHTKGLKVTEKLRVVDGKLEYQAIADDPAVLAEPWHLPVRKLKRTDEPMNEPLPCVEQDLDHVVDGTHHDNAR